MEGYSHLTFKGQIEITAPKTEVVVPPHSSINFRLKYGP